MWPPMAAAGKRLPLSFSTRKSDQRRADCSDTAEATAPLTEKRCASSYTKSARVAEAGPQALRVGGGSGTSSTTDPNGACSTWGVGLAEESTSNVADATAIAKLPKCGQEWPCELPCVPLPTHPVAKWFMAAEWPECSPAMTVGT